MTTSMPPMAMGSQLIMPFGISSCQQNPVSSATLTTILE